MVGERLERMGRDGRQWEGMKLFKDIPNILRTIWFFIGAFLYLYVYGVIVMIISLIFGKKVRKFVLKQVELFGRLAYRLLGIKVYTLGKKPVASKNYLVVANHQSLMDIPLVIGYVGPMAFIAKKELGRFPVVNYFLKYLDSELIDRGNPRQTVTVIRSVMDKLKNGTHFFIFPEGTRSPDGKLQPFKPKSLEIAFKTKVPILPVAIYGNDKVIPKKKLIVKGSKAGIYIGEIIDTNEFSSEEELRNFVQEKIREYISELEKVVEKKGG